MNLDTMRTLFRKHVAGLADDDENTEVETYLNRAYRYAIPADIGGELRETLWQLQCTAGTNSYDYDAHIIAPNGESAWIESYGTVGGSTTEVGLTFLDWETDYTTWKFWDEADTNSQARPSSILLYGRKVYLSPIPDEDYIVNIPARGGPSADLTDTGLTNDLLAQAVITMAAKEFLAEQEDVDGAMREKALYEQHKSHLQVYAQGRPNQRRPARSF